MKIDVAGLLRQGQENQDREHVNGEREKLGTLRGGSVGCILEDERIVGVSMRQALARYEGLYENHAPDKKIMFGLGLANEDIWANLLEKANVNFLREEELGLEWNIEGVKATGRPDIVICDDSNKPALGLELKMVASVWSARGVLSEFKPKISHMIQAGNYSYRMGIPFELWYTSYVNLAGPDFATRIMPKRGEEMSEWIEYTLGEMKVSSRSKTGKPTLHKIHVYAQDIDLSNEELKDKYGVTASQFKHIRPFRVGYQLEWRGNDLWWKPVGMDAEMIKSPITKSGIDSYYKQILKHSKEKTLPEETIAADIFGTKQKFRLEDYSTIDKASQEATDFEDWKRRILELDKWTDLTGE